MTPTRAIRWASVLSAVSTWYESALLPGRLRIDVGKPAEGNGVLYTHDSTYMMASGSLKKAVSGGNPLIPVLFDVYVVPVDRTLADMRQTLEIDTSKVSESTFDGRPVYVIGADILGHQGRRPIERVALRPGPVEDRAALVTLGSTSRA